MSDVFNSPLSAIVGVLAVTLPVCLLFWWLHRRDERRWAVREQVRAMEQQIWLETLPDWQREAILESRQQQVEIHQEARRRLGLPEEEP
jgi:hypothetical protein